MSYGNILRLVGQTIILLSILMQFVALNMQNKGSNTLEIYQSRLWDAEHRRSLNDRLIAKTKDIGLSRPMEKKRAKLLDKESSAREALIRASLRIAVNRGYVRYLEIVAAAIFLLGSILLICGEILLARKSKAK